MGDNKTWPKQGDKLTHRYRKRRGQVEVEVVSVSHTTESVVVKAGDTTYRSLSAAAAAFSGHPTNGWIFWGLKKSVRRQPS
jgi:hypothetical protein